MTINPPTVGPFDEPRQCVRINHEWITHLIGLANYGDLGGYWSSDEEDGQDGMRAILDVLAKGNCDGGSMEYPRQMQRFANEFVVYSGDALDVAVNAAYPFVIRAYQPNAAIGDRAGMEIYLEAGPADVFVFHQRASNMGKYQFYMNGVDFETEQDLYASATDYKAIIQLDAIVTLYGRNLLEWECVGKNASSSGYFWTFSAIWVISQLGIGPSG